MSTKNKRRTTRDNPKSAALSVAALADKAQAALSAGDFRDAITDYKLLLKQDPRPEWRTGLASAYAGRARELSTKGMLKEALVMWENRAALDPNLPMEADQCTLLARLGRFEALLARLADPKAPEALAERLRALLAARILGGDRSLLERIAPEDPLRRHAEAARESLDAYCAGDDERAREALSRLPFRSAYRDWSAILKALLTLNENPQEAQRQLGRLPEDSPFSAIKASAELVLLPESVFLERWPMLSQSQRAFASALRGWSPERLAFWDGLQRLGTPPKPELLVRFLHAQRKRLGEDWARRTQLRILAHHWPESERWLRAASVAPLDEIESLQLDAWNVEIAAPDPWDLQECWNSFALELKSNPGERAKDPDHKAIIALALRRADQLFDALSIRRTPAGEISEIQEAVCEGLELSLESDPDLETYLRLIAFYRHAERPKDSRRLLEVATRHWPEDRRVIQATMEAALDTGAFKKAAGLARRLLAIDPINTEVRERLVAAHLAHARKQVLKSRLDLARKELDAAREWARGESAREQVELVAAFLDFIEDPAAGTLSLAPILERLGRGLSGRLALILAGGDLGLEPLRILRALALDASIKPDRADLLAAFERLRRHLDGGRGFARALEPFLTKALAKAPWKELSRTELETVCETLKRARFDRIRGDVAKLALKRWRKAPIFVLHAFESKHPNGILSPLSHDIFDLEQALETASAEGDDRTATRIHEALIRSRPFGFGPPGPFGGGFFDFDAEDDEYENDPLGDFGDLTLPPGLDGSPEQFAAIFRLIGLEKMLDLLDAPLHVRRDLREAARERGEKAVIQEFIEMIDQLLGIGGGRKGRARPRKRR
jgi:cellulose synthase operon protein C